MGSCGYLLKGRWSKERVLKIEANTYATDVRTCLGNEENFHSVAERSVYK